MSIEPTIKETDNPDIAGEERRVDRDERHADRPSSTAEVAKDLERPEGAATSVDAATTLFPEKEANDFRARWTDIQTGFVDEPRCLVEQSGALVAEVMKLLA